MYQHIDKSKPENIKLGVSADRNRTRRLLGLLPGLRLLHFRFHSRKKSGRDGIRSGARQDRDRRKGLRVGHDGGEVQRRVCRHEDTELEVRRSTRHH